MTAVRTSAASRQPSAIRPPTLTPVPTPAPSTTRLARLHVRGRARVRHPVRVRRSGAGVAAGRGRRVRRAGPEQRRRHPGQVESVRRRRSRPAPVRGSAGVADQLEDERQRSSSMVRSRCRPRTAMTADDQGQQQHVRHRIGQGRPRRPRGPVEPSAGPKAGATRRSAPSAPTAPSSHGRPEQRHPDVHQCEEVHGDQRIDREVGELGEGREGPRPGAIASAKSRLPTTRDANGADRPPGDPLGPHAARRPRAEGGGAERHDVEEDQVVARGERRSAERSRTPVAKSADRRDGADEEQPTGRRLLSRADAVTCHLPEPAWPTRDRSGLRSRVGGPPRPS